MGVLRPTKSVRPALFLLTKALLLFLRASATTDCTAMKSCVKSTQMMTNIAAPSSMSRPMMFMQSVDGSKYLRWVTQFTLVAQWLKSLFLRIGIEQSTTSSRLNGCQYTEDIENKVQAVGRVSYFWLAFWMIVSHLYRPLISMPQANSERWSLSFGTGRRKPFGVFILLPLWGREIIFRASRCLSPFAHNRLSC